MIKNQGRFFFTFRKPRVRRVLGKNVWRNTLDKILSHAPGHENPTPRLDSLRIADFSMAEFNRKHTLRRTWNCIGHIASPWQSPITAKFLFMRFPAPLLIGLIGMSLE
jgi:hypothetical protein